MNARKFGGVCTRNTRLGLAEELGFDMSAEMNAFKIIGDCVRNTRLDTSTEMNARKIIGVCMRRLGLAERLEIRYVC